ncbi:MAG: hypothetical protein Q7S08_04180 [bacterium]|nr:hypothetical protein [bacterium]
MMLTTHALMGTAAASLFPEQPIVAFVAGFASHFVLDAIHHWDYDEYLSSIQKNPTNPLETDMRVGSRVFLRDLMLIAGDAVLGLTLSILLFHFLLFQVPLRIVVIGVCAGIVPDALQFVYWKTRAKTRVLEPLQRFHIWIQEGKKLHVKPWVGIGLQCALVAVVIIALKLIA